MYFNHDTTSDDHIAVAHHRLQRAELAPDLSGFVLWLESWPTEAARLDGRAPVARWHVLATAAGLPLADGLEAAVQAAVLASPEFAGATVIADAVGSLAAAQERKWAEVKAERTARLGGTFEHGGHLFNVDPLNLTGAAVDAMLASQAGETYAQPWVLADNTVLELDAEQQIAIGRACKAYIAGLWAISQQLRGEIEAASTPEAVASITWP